MSVNTVSQQNKNRDGRRVLAFLRPYKKWVIADSIVIAISQVFSALIPTLALSWLIDTIIPNENHSLAMGVNVAVSLFCRL